MKWMKEIENYNFLGIYDVMLDIKTELDISSDKIIIPLLQTRIKFEQLFPLDSITTRDNYCDLRWKAIGFLVENDIIKNFKLIKGFHRWDNKIEIELDRETFKKILNKMKIEFEKRFMKEKIEEMEKTKSFWDLLHPKIGEVSKSRFESNHFADSVEAALKELNNIVKVIVKQKTGREYDGANLMNRAFSLQNPIILLDDLSSETGKNIQKGYMQIFSGSMTGIRNPKTHKNIKIERQRAIHFLFLSSLLLYKIDEGRIIRNNQVQPSDN